MTVNDAVYVVAAEPAASLLQVLRNDIGLNGPKYGCGLGQCGACLVLVDGKAARSCVLPPAAVVLYSTALSPMPVTALAFATPAPLLMAAAICSGETASAVVESG